MGFLSKKDKSADNDDSSRSALFGSRKNKSAEPAKNPYAAQSSPDPYANKAAQNGYGQAPPPYNSQAQNDQMDRFRTEKSPVPHGGYGAMGGAPQQPQQRGYGGQGAYGGQSGYGSDRYGQQQPQQPSGLPSRPGGYGGLGRTNSKDTVSTEAGRNELFGAAPQRYEQRQQQAVQPGGYGGEGQQSGVGGSMPGEYGAYQDRELTAEEQEEEDVRATKDQIKFIKQQDVASTRNMVRIAQQAEETGRGTLERLAAQGERIHNTEKNLDLASNQNRIAEDKAKELKTLNRSMFAMHVSNPFTASKRREERDAAIMDRHRMEREQRDQTRALAYSSQARQGEFQQDLKTASRTPAQSQRNLAERSKYQFEADSEDEEMENEIDQNLDIAHQAVGRMNHLAKAMGREVDEQNTHIQRIIGKTDKVDDQIAMNRARLDRIK